MYLKSNIMISFSKLSKMAILAFINGLRLHFDSVILIENKSYPSATMLSVLAMEEFGKYFSLSSYMYYSSVNDNRDEQHEMNILSMLYKHPFKQSTCFGRDGFEPNEELRIKAADRYFEDLKHRSMYVGFDREKGEILVNKKVNNPYKVNRKKSLKQVLFLNDLLIGLTKDRVEGRIELDEEEVNHILNKKLLKKLKKVKKNIS